MLPFLRKISAGLSSSSRTSSETSSRTDSESTESEHTENVRDPRAEKLKFFHFRIHRVDAQPMLRRNGDFILRRMKQGGSEKYVVSVRWEETVKHFPIQRTKGRYCFEARCFRDIRDLIDYYMNTGMPLTLTSGARLERPKERQSWELLSHQIERKRQLGRGNFGTVFEATLTTKKGSREVAAKTLDRVALEWDETKIETARVEMLEEARIMRAVSGHQNIVAAFGVTIDQCLPIAIMELVRGGSVERFLRRGEAIQMETKLRFAYEASAGVKYIHSKGYLHRDLATRNCLIERKGEKLGHLKITDFGLAKFVGDKVVYKATTVSQMPVAWSAIESLVDFVWTAESDVWSLGVLIWEILTDGHSPYYDIETFDRMAAISHLRSGQRLEFPEGVHPAVTEAIGRCWEELPSKRPTPTMIQEAVKKAMKRK